MAGKPAARLTDMTAHGGTVMGPGVPTVLIGKMPAATLGDQHICPMMTPGTPPIPHVGGPILLGSTGVFIGKKPAARVGDMAMCVGPPSQIVLGCFTVLVGEAGSGSQAGSAAAAAAASARPPQGPKAVQAMTLAAPTSSPVQAYQILARLQDKGGRPLSGLTYRIQDPSQAILKGASTTDGAVQHSGYSKAGSYNLTLGCLGEVKWSANPVEIGKESTLTCATDAEGGTQGFLFVSLVLEDGSRLYMDRIEAPISGGKLQGKWTLAIDRWKTLFEDEDLSFSGVEAVAMIPESLGISKVIPLDTDFKIVVKDIHGQLLANHDVEFQQADGTTLKAKTDGSGKIRIKAGSSGSADLATHPVDETATS
jgi:uncharacterized Zn-binding protein involved in type VI secretion